MTLENKVMEVEKIYYVLDQVIHDFKKKSGLRCLRFCSRCCVNPNISATILEFLPLAYQLYKRHQCEPWLIKLKENQGSHHTGCMLLGFSKYRGNIGRCLAYKYRPLICRLFGFSAVLDKTNHPLLTTCRMIKTTFPEKYSRAVRSLESDCPAPIMKNYYMMMYTIDYRLVQSYYPLSTALQLAIETVLSHFSYDRDACAVG